MERARIVLILTAVLCATVFGPATWAVAPPYGVTVRELIPLANWQKQFKITDGKDQGRLVPLTFQNGTREGWRLNFGDYAGVHLRNDTTGALVMDRLDLFKSRSFIVYEPALPILARDIASGVSILRQANFKMYDRDTGKLKRTGHASHLVKQVSRSQFETPAGLIEGYYIEIEHRMDMQFAQLNMSLGLGCRLDEGPVYGTGRYTLRKLGLFSETKTAAAALAIR
ncbi:MAG TPA: hypothetical protein VGK77_21750 [Candidatus Binatia bacterium]|jgi:hypothetical protein